MDRYEIGKHLKVPWDDPRLTPRWHRLYRWGSFTIASWWLFCFAFMIGSVASHWGPFGWIASAEIHVLGSEGPIIGALPGLLLMGLPGLIVSKMAKTVDRPFLFGMQDGFDDKRSPRLERPPGNQRRRMRRMMWGGLIVGVVGLGLLGVGWWRVDRMDAAPRTPLPVLSFARIASGIALPTSARVDGVVSYPGTRWTHDTTVRQTLYRDVYYPLARAGWRPAQAVRLVELDRTLPNDAPGPDNAVDAPGPREGALRSLDDDWLARQLTAAGMKIADHAVILERKPLKGLQPAASDDSILPGLLIFLGAFTFVAFLFAWAARRALRTFVDPAGGEAVR